MLSRMNKKWHANTAKQKLSQNIKWWSVEFKYIFVDTELKNIPVNLSLSFRISF